MEGLILAIIIAIAGSLLSGKNKKKEEKSMPPFNNKPVDQQFKQERRTEQQAQPKSLEDFARGIFEQLNEKTDSYPDLASEQQRASKVESEQNEPVIEVQKELNKRKSLLENRSSKRIRQEMIPEEKIDDVIKENEIGQFVPNSKQALVQAIITSEIIGPPKAKQRT